MTSDDKVFAGPVPEIYQKYLVPLIFESYAVDLALRLAVRRPGRVLEVAAGTGVVSRRLSAALGPDVTIVATDLNQGMLAQAVLAGAVRTVEWRQADAMSLPFADGCFDAVVCQFGAMFFPDRAKAFAEAHRVLRAGGLFVFNVWDGLADNEFADTVTAALARLFPRDPPRFLARTPHGYHDRRLIAADLAAGGFVKPARMETVAARSRAEAPWIPALAYCQGTPLRDEIERCGAGRLDEATRAATRAIARKFGAHAVDGKIQAQVIAAER